MDAVRGRHPVRAGMKSSARCPDYEMQIAWKRHIDFLAHCRSAKTVALAWIHFRRAVMRHGKGLRAGLGRLAFHDPVSAIDSLNRSIARSTLS